MIDKTKSIFVEYCVNCSNHAWCTKHDEAKYKNFFDLVQQGLEQEFQEFTVYGNHNARTGKTIIPRLGAFEITFQDHIVFSKLKTSMWPTMDAVIHRIKLVLRGRSLTEYNVDELQQKREKQNSRSARKTPTRAGRGKVPKSNHSYLDMNEEHGSFREYREEYSMMQMSSKNQTTVRKELPYVNKNLIKREITPTRLEGMGMGMHFFDEKQHVKLAYLDAQGRVVNLTRENQLDYLQKKYETEAVSPIHTRTMYDHPNPYPYMTTPDHNSSVFAQKAAYSRTNYQLDDAQRGADYRKSGSVPISKRRHRDETGLENGDGMLYTDKTMKTEDSDASLIKTRNKSSQKNELNRTFTTRAADGSKLPLISNIKNQKNVLQGVFVFKGKIIQEKDLLGLDTVEFPEQKFSEIRIPKEGIKKKKITMIADTTEDCKIDIYSTTPEILAMEANDISVSKGSLFKIALKFGRSICEGLRECYLFLFKDNKPWLKIMIQLSYL